MKKFKNIVSKIKPNGHVFRPPSLILLQRDIIIFGFQSLKSIKNIICDRGSLHQILYFNHHVLHISKSILFYGIILNIPSIGDLFNFGQIMCNLKHQGREGLIIYMNLIRGYEILIILLFHSRRVESKWNRLPPTPSQG